MDHWTDDFWNTMNGAMPDAPLPVSLAKVTSTAPLTVTLRKIHYSGKNLKVSDALVRHERKADIILADPSMGTKHSHANPTDCRIITKPVLATGDLVAVVHLDGKQTLLILTKVVDA